MLFAVVLIPWTSIALLRGGQFLGRKITIAVGIEHLKSDLFALLSRNETVVIQVRLRKSRFRPRSHGFKVTIHLSFHFGSTDIAISVCVGLGKSVASSALIGHLEFFKTDEAVAVTV
jgi:hypothetical protein